uniref:Endonuclease/exonuclease/phosphatase domain-containing protein n=1 Tax=Cacopsylla melanoneura TaxID=428564 RepID=A0A8D8PTU0_9HEMI
MDRDLILTKKTRGGGVLIALQNIYEIEFLQNWSSSDTYYDCIWVHIFSPVNIYLCVVYFPPPVTTKHIERFNNSLDKLKCHLSDCLIIGDFNLKEIDSPESNLALSTSRCKELLNLLNFYNLI